MRALRAREPDDEQGGGENRQHPHQHAHSAAAAPRHIARQADIRIFNGGDRSAPSTPQQYQRQQCQQPKPLRLQEAGHA